MSYEGSINRKNSSLKSLKSIPRQVSDDAYFAGIIDGEGSIMIAKRHNGEGRPAWTLRIAISMGDPEAIRWAHDLYGGWLMELPVDAKRNHRKPRYILRYETEAALEILRIVLPYLKVKVRQAALAFKFRKLIEQTFGTKDEHRLKLRDEMVAEMQRLNHPYGPRKHSETAVETVRAESQLDETPEIQETIQ